MKEKLLLKPGEGWKAGTFVSIRVGSMDTGDPNLITSTVTQGREEEEIQ